MFSAALSSAFAGRSAGCIGPMMAQAALVDGAAWRLVGHSAVIGSRVLIGPAGKTYAFSSPESAAKWASHTAAAGTRQQTVIDGLGAVERAKWITSKRAKLQILAGRLVKAAEKEPDAKKRAALIAESDYCLAKWG